MSDDIKQLKAKNWEQNDNGKSVDRLGRVISDVRGDDKCRGGRVAPPSFV